MPSAKPAKGGARYFEFAEGSSCKFWEIRVEGKTFSTRYGRIGTEGQVTQKRFDTPAKAEAEVSKLIAEKMKKGYVEGSSSAAQPVMDLPAFWRFIDGARAKAKTKEGFMEEIASKLRALRSADILAFQRHFRKLHAGSSKGKLWGAAYLMNGGCSDDGFEYFRAWLISQGQQAFESALKDPDSLVSFAAPDAELEELMYAAAEAYEEKTGEEMPESMAGEPSEADLSWDFDDAAEMKKRYPKLFAKFGG